MTIPNIHRKVDDELERYLGRFPVVGLLGARQTGKTHAAKKVAGLLEGAVYLDLENPEHLALLQNPVFYLREQKDKTVIVDEVQRMPELFPVLRSLVDEDRRPGRFLLLGSASPSLLRSSGESLAGRVAYLFLSGMSLAEILPYHTMQAHWLRGGFPETLFDEDTEMRKVWHRSFISTYVEQDLPALGLNTKLPLGRLLSMLAWQHGGLLNKSDLSRSLGMTLPTVGKAIEWFQQTFLIRELSPYFPNVGKRVIKTPKLYLRDSGLLHHLLGTGGDEQSLLGHPKLGMSWEGYALEQIADRLGEGTDLYFYRTQKGADCDLLVVRDGRVEAAVDFKISPGKIEKGFRIAMEDTGAKKGYLVYANSSGMQAIDEGIYGSGLLAFLEEIGK